MNNQHIQHDARLDKLETLGSWELENKSQDIRGRPLVTTQGQRIGVIDDLLVDKKDERVSAVRLDDGAACGVECLEIHPDKVIYRKPGVAGKAAEDVKGKAAAGVGEKRIPLVEEEVAIGKRAVEGDTIRVRAHVIKDKVSEDVKLRDENVDVKRRELNQPISGRKADALFKDKTVTVTERDEEAVVAKTAKVKGEVVVTKDAGERVEHIDETVRRTKVDVDRSNAPDKKSDPRKPARH